MPSTSNNKNNKKKKKKKGARAKIKDFLFLQGGKGSCLLDASEEVVDSEVFRDGPLLREGIKGHPRKTTYNDVVFVDELDQFPRFDKLVPVVCSC